MGYQIRQLGLGGILDQAVKLTKDNFGLLLGIAMALEVPCAVVQGYVTQSLVADVPQQLTDENVIATQQEGLKSLPLLFGVILLNAYVVIPITNAAMVYAIADRYLDKPASIGKAFRQALARLFAMVWTWFLLGMAIMGGLMLCIVPGILAIFWFGLATQVVILEGTSGFAALKRSRFLMTGNIANLFALGLLLLAINGGITGGASFIPQKDLAIFASAIAQGVTSIFSAAAIVVFYFSTRCQHENFDLTLLAQAVGAESPPEITAAEGEPL